MGAAAGKSFDGKRVPIHILSEFIWAIGTE